MQFLLRFYPYNPKISINQFRGLIYEWFNHAL